MWTSGKLSGGSAAPRAATDLPQLTRATSQARLEPVAGGGARPRPAAPWNFRAKSAAAPLPSNRPERQAGRSPGTPGASDPPPEVTGERTPVEGKYSAAVGPPPRALRNLTSQPPYTGGPGAALSGAGLPAPAWTVKLRRPEVPPPDGVTGRGATAKDRLGWWPGAGPGPGAVLGLVGVLVLAPGRDLRAWAAPSTPHRWR